MPRILTAPADMTVNPHHMGTATLRVPITNGGDAGASWPAGQAAA